MKIRPFTAALRLIGAGLSLPVCAFGSGPLLSSAACAGLLLLACAAVGGARAPLEVPLSRIDRAHRTDARSILEKPTLVRRLPTTAFRADSVTYVYLVDNLPISSRLSDLLGFGSYRVEKMEDGSFHGWDFTGINGYFWLVHSAPGARIYWCEGSYDSWFVPKISAKMLLVVEFRKVPAADRESEPGVMATEVDVYVSTNRLVGFLMDFLGELTDKKLSQLITASQYTSEKLSSDPLEVWGKMNSSDLFSPEELESLRGTILPEVSPVPSTTPR